MHHWDEQQWRSWVKRQRRVVERSSRRQLEAYAELWGREALYQITAMRNPVLAGYFAELSAHAAYLHAAAVEAVTA